MPFTQLSPSATPGKPYTFLAKTAASGTHTGLFTELSVMATPGGIHAFVAKTPATPGTGDHIGLFTELSVMAIPGMRHVFHAKTAWAEPVPIPSLPAPGHGAGGGGGGWLATREAAAYRDWERERILREDNELLELLPILLMGLN